MFGFSAGETAGQSLDLIVPENLRARHWSGYRRVMETSVSRYGHGDLLSVPGLTKDGRRISVEFTIVMLRNEAQEITGYRRRDARCDEALRGSQGAETQARRNRSGRSVIKICLCPAAGFRQAPSRCRRSPARTVTAGSDPDRDWNGAMLRLDRRHDAREPIRHPTQQRLPEWHFRLR